MRIGRLTSRLGMARPRLWFVLFTVATRVPLFSPGPIGPESAQAQAGAMTTRGEPDGKHVEVYGHKHVFIESRAVQGAVDPPDELKAGI